MGKYEYMDLFAIFATRSNQGGAMHYTLKDHQGSLTATK